MQRSLALCSYLDVPFIVRLETEQFGVQLVAPCRKRLKSVYTLFIASGDIVFPITRLQGDLYSGQGLSRPICDPAKKLVNLGVSPCPPST